MTTYQYGINDADGRAYIYDNSPITAMFYYATAGEPWDAPTPGDGYYGIGRNGQFYDNGSPTGPTLNGTSFGTLLGGFNRKTWMIDQEPLAIGSWSTDKMTMEIIADDHVKHTSLVPLTDYGWARYLSSRQRWFITGDFDVQVEFENRSVSSGSDGNTPMLRAYIDENNWSFIRKRHDNAYNSNTFTNGSWHSDGFAWRTDSAGKLRLTRTGNVFNNYYWNGSSWVLLHTSYSDTVLALPVVIEILVGGIGNLTVSRVDTFGFTINSGTAINTAGWTRESSGTHRGARADFPAKALLIATEDSVNIIDIENDKLWMRMLRTWGYALNTFGDASSIIKKIYIKNGRLFVCMNDGSTSGNLVTFDFSLDFIISQRILSDSKTGQLKRCHNGVYWAPAGLGPRELSPYGMICSRNRGNDSNGDLNNYQILTNATYASATAQNGNKHYWATGCDTGISVHSVQHAYYDGDAAVGRNLGAPQCVHHNLSARIVDITFRHDTYELFYQTITTVYSISLANLETALLADPNGGAFSADTSAILPGTRSAPSQDKLVAHAGYVFVPRDEGVYRISWPAGTSELFYGDVNSSATHKILFPHGKVLTINYLIITGPITLLLIGMENGIVCANLSTNLAYDGKALLNYDPIVVAA